MWLAPKNNGLSERKCIYFKENSLICALKNLKLHWPKIWAGSSWMCSIWASFSYSRKPPVFVEFADWADGEEAHRLTRCWVHNTFLHKHSDPWTLLYSTKMIHCTAHWLLIGALCKTNWFHLSNVCIKRHKQWSLLNIEMEMKAMGSYLDFRIELQIERYLL